MWTQPIYRLLCWVLYFAVTVICYDSRERNSSPLNWANLRGGWENWEYAGTMCGARGIWRSGLWMGSSSSSVSYTRWSRLRVWTGGNRNCLFSNDELVMPWRRYRSWLHIYFCLCSYFSAGRMIYDGQEDGVCLNYLYSSQFYFDLDLDIF